MGGARRTSWRRRPPSATAIRCRPSRSCRRSCSRRPGRARCRWWPLPASSAMHRGWGRQILPAPPALRAARWRRVGRAAGAGLIGSRTCYLLSTSCSAAWRSSGCAGCAGRGGGGAAEAAVTRPLRAAASHGACRCARPEGRRRTSRLAAVTRPCFLAEIILASCRGPSPLQLTGFFAQADRHDRSTDISSHLGRVPCRSCKMNFARRRQPSERAVRAR